MPFPATNGTAAPIGLDAAWSGARNTASQIQAQAVSLSAQIAAGPVSAAVIIAALSFLTPLNAQLTTYAAVPGIAAYAQTQVNNESLNVATAFSAMQSALVAVVNWILSNYPVDSSGYLQDRQFISGQVAWSVFTTAQLAGLATLLAALSATID